MSQTIDSVQVQMPETKVPGFKKLHSKVELEKAAKQFEGLFMDMVMKSMRDTIPESDTMGDSQKTKFFQGMLDSEYAKAMQGKIGLADAIVRQLGPKLETKTDEAKKT